MTRPTLAQPTLAQPYIEYLVDKGIATQAEYRQICEMAIASIALTAENAQLKDDLAHNAITITVHPKVKQLEADATLGQQVRAMRESIAVAAEYRGTDTVTWRHPLRELLAIIDAPPAPDQAPKESARE